MSGPPYPHQSPAPGSNAIGIGAIGTMQIGAIPQFDVWSTVLMQYANSPTIASWIESYNAAADMTVPISNFFDMMWNVLTAQGYGLDVWGRIVGLQGGRTIQVPGSASLFGFNEAGGSWTGFDQGGFYTGQGLNTNFVLTDPDFRRLILAKAAGNISDGAIVSVNRILLALFPGRGDCWVADGLNMQLTYTFAFPLTPVELAIVLTAGVLPNAAGAVINVSQL